MAKVFPNAAIDAARVAGLHPGMDQAMRKVESAVRAEAAKHTRTGAFERSIQSGRVPGPKGVTDRAVWTNTPEAWSIEFGHVNNRSGKHVVGNFVFTNAARRFS